MNDTTNDAPMTPEKTYSGFMSAAMEFLAAQGPHASVLIIVEGQRGFQTLRNQNSLPWITGACECCKEMYKELGKQMADKEKIDRVAQEEEDRLDNAVKQVTTARKQ